MPKNEWEPWDLYPAYEAARDEADAALAGWSRAPLDLRRDAYAAYRAAVEREDAAAAAWLAACLAYDRAQAVTANG